MNYEQEDYLLEEARERDRNKKKELIGIFDEEDGYVEYKLKKKGD